MVLNFNSWAIEHPTAEVVSQTLTTCAAEEGARQMLALAVRYYEPSPPPVIETDPELGNQLYKEAKRLLIDRFEREYLTKLIEEPDTTLSRASKQAGIERAYLTDLLRKHGLRVPGES